MINNPSVLEASSSFPELFLTPAPIFKGSSLGKESLKRGKLGETLRDIKNELDFFEAWLSVFLKVFGYRFYYEQQVPFVHLLARSYIDPSYFVSAICRVKLSIFTGI